MEQKLDDLAFRFFKLFAQYEFSLKSKGYFQVTGTGKIIVDWDRFANERIGNDFIKALGDKAEAANYILKRPPKKQTVTPENLIVWKEVPNTDKSVQVLFGHISRIRNNLYHGAKFNGTWFDPKRSFHLLKSGLQILEHFQDSTQT